MFVPRVLKLSDEENSPARIRVGHEGNLYVRLVERDVTSFFLKNLARSRDCVVVAVKCDRYKLHIAAVKCDRYKLHNEV